MAERVPFLSEVSQPMNGRPEERDRLIKLVRQVRDARDRGIPAGPWLTPLREASICPDPENLCFYTDLPEETIADICLGWADSQRRLDRAGLVALVQRIRESAGVASEAAMMLLVSTFEFNCVHPAGTDLLFYPEETFGAGIDPTAEQVADRALRSG